MRTLLFLALSLPAIAQTPVPRYEVKRAAGPIVVDGKLDDKAWANAAPIELVFPWNFQTGAKQKTRVRLLWDDDNLYAGYDCEDTDIVAFFTERDDPTYRDDAVEIFINPNPAQTGIYFGLEMNARGVLYDYLSHNNAKYVFKRFNLQGVRLATHIDGTLNMTGDKDKGWSLEVAIPWANFEEVSKPPAAGTIWAANMNRWDGVEPSRRLSMWSNSLLPKPNPHAAERFGQLVFVK